MITWGATGNSNKQSYFSLGAIASGVTHMFTRFRTAADGASLHPLQRQGAVFADYHVALGHGRHVAMGPSSIGDSVPAAMHIVTYPPVITIPGSGRDPAMRV